MNVKWLQFDFHTVAIAPMLRVKGECPTTVVTTTL